MTRRRVGDPIALFPHAVTAPEPSATVPPGHPLEFWELEEAAKHTRLSESFLEASQCPRAKVGRRVLFDPVETVLWVRSHLSNRPTP